MTDCSLVPFVDYSESRTEATGVAHAYGNKGGVAVALNVHDLRLCFVNAHLVRSRSHPNRAVPGFSPLAAVMVRLLTRTRLRAATPTSRKSFRVRFALLHILFLTLLLQVCTLARTRSTF